MLSRVRVSIDDTVLKRLRDAIQSSPRDFYTVVSRQVLPAAQKRLDEALNTPPGPVRYPFEFASAKSRAYYFATHEPPYVRTGEILQWRVILMAYSGQRVEMRFENPSPVAPYVFGPRQQPGHRNTGWKNADAELPAMTEAVLADLAEAWVELIPAQMRVA